MQSDDEKRAIRSARMKLAVAAKGRGAKTRLWLRAYLDESNSTTFLQKTASARAAGYRCSTQGAFAAIGNQNYNKLKTEITQWLDLVGLGENYLKLKALQLLEAKEVKYFAHEGVVTDQREVEALDIQRRTLEMLGRWKGWHVTRTEVSGPDGGPLQLLGMRFEDLPEERQAELRRAGAILAAQRTQPRPLPPPPEPDDEEGD